MQHKNTFFNNNTFNTSPLLLHPSISSSWLFFYLLYWKTEFVKLQNKLWTPACIRVSDSGWNDVLSLLQGESRWGLLQRLPLEKHTSRLLAVLVHLLIHACHFFTDTRVIIHIQHDFIYSILAILFKFIPLVILTVLSPHRIICYRIHFSLQRSHFMLFIFSFICLQIRCFIRL